MIHLDTQVAIWLFIQKPRLISNEARRLISRETVVMSPMALLEYEVLVERRRFPDPADVFLETLSAEIGLSLSACPFASIVVHARTFAWTRDPFDRLIVANAMADSARLVTADAMILDNFKDAVW